MFWLDIKIAWFMATRQIMRSSIWTTVLIIGVMTLTSLNLIVISGILVGLIEGSVRANKNYYTGDIIVSKLQEKDYIENSNAVISQIESIPGIKNYSARYLDGVTIEANYRTRTDDTKRRDTAGAQAVGINPEQEDSLTGISQFIVEGEYLTSQDYDKVLIGAYLLKKYLPIDSPGFAALENIGPGTKIRITFNEDVTREFTVKGILKAKVDELTTRVYFVDSQLRGLIGREDFNVDEISIMLDPGINPNDITGRLKAAGVGSVAKVQTFSEAEPKFLKDIKATFALLGNAISSIGLAVASITVFIVIFINAITRRKFIGIAKGIGISGRAIEFSYVMQSFFYAICGSFIGLVLVYLFLEPYFAANPIDFPFSDGILVAPINGTAFRVGLLILATIIAGYIPARMIVRKNTLDSILGRN
jgi:ABC-type lipoprotein release transport system permease subunit